MKFKLVVSLIVLAGLIAVMAMPAAADDPVCSGICGDVNNDGSVNVGDLVYFQNWLWKGGPPPPCPEQADMNCYPGPEVGDYIWLFNYIFKGGPAPCDC